METVWRYVKGAPLTYSWLVLLLIATIILHSIPAHLLAALLQKESTNLHHLASDPIRVLVQSLLWIDGKYWWPYLIVFTLFLAPADRWLGHLRWLVVGLVCHAGATYLSEGYLYCRIQEALVVFGVSLAVNRDFTQLGHFSALLIGLACYPLTRSRQREPAAA